MSIIELKNISKSFGVKSKRISVLENVNFKVEEGEMVAITGKSGAGKSTLLNIIAAIDYPDAGSYYFDEEKVDIKTVSQGIRFRKNKIGMILQNYALIDDLSVYDNVELGLWEARMDKSQRKEKVLEILDILGIYKLRWKYPGVLSGGEKQRVAIARAVVNKHKVLLADEPTGSLDSENERRILKIIQGLNKNGLTVVMATHDIDVANACNRVFVLEKN